MKDIRRWDPENHHPVENFKNELSDVFQRFFEDRSFMPSPSSFFNKMDSYTPAMNIE